jgi:hypothetical protein
VISAVMRADDPEAAVRALLVPSPGLA